MNTRLLKRYRRKAFRDVKLHVIDEKIFIKCLPTNEHLHDNLNFFAYIDGIIYWRHMFFQTYNIEEAKETLKVARRIYILELVRKERERRFEEKISVL